MELGVGSDKIEIVGEECFCIKCYLNRRELIKFGQDEKEWN